MKPLGRRTPTTDEHIRKYPFTVNTRIQTVNKTLVLPSWHWSHDQGGEGACVGYGTSMMMSIINRRRYNPTWLWNEAKSVDEWPDTNPGDDNGTSVAAACDVLRAEGHVLWSHNPPPNLGDGIKANRWALTVDDMRASLALGIPISIGINWYTNFDNPSKHGIIRPEYWIGRGSLGTVRGGHCVCVYGASDKRHAFRIKNSWGRDYPLVWMPYTVMSILLHQEGEACLVTDR